MNTRIKATGITLTPAISDYAAARVAKIEKILGSDTSLQCDMELAKTTSHHHKGDIFMAEMHIVGAGKNFFARSEGQDLYAAIDEVHGQIMGELRRGKGKRMAFVRKGGARMKEMAKGLWPWK